LRIGQPTIQDLRLLSALHAPVSLAVCPLERQRTGSSADAALRARPCLTGEELSKEEGYRFAVESGKVLQFNHVHAPFSRLALRDEGLWSTERLRHLDLTQTRLATRLPEPLHQVPVASGMKGTHGPLETPGARDIPKGDILAPPLEPSRSGVFRSL
jgi:hypothetical protein